MYQLLLKQKIRFIIRLVKRNKSGYIVLGCIIPCVLITQAIIMDIMNTDIVVFIPYGILCFHFMNLFGNIPRLRIEPEQYIWKIEKPYIWRVKKLIKSVLITFGLSLIILLCFPMNEIVLKQFLIVMIFNPLINIHTVMLTQYKYHDAANLCVLIILLVSFFFGMVGLATIVMALYGLLFVLYRKFNYKPLITFYQHYNQMLYGFLNKDYDSVLQIQDEMFFQNNKKIFRGLMKTTYGNRYCLLISYELIILIRRRKQILNQYYAVVIISMLLSQLQEQYVTYVLLFAMLALGQNIANYSIQNEKRVIKNGFYLPYSLAEKLLCKSGIGILVMLFPMLCYWLNYKIEIYGVILWIWTPIQCIIMSSIHNKIEKFLYSSIFYFLAILSMGLLKYVSF